jgi:hypothetical protein
MLLQLVQEHLQVASVLVARVWTVETRSTMRTKSIGDERG